MTTTQIQEAGGPAFPHTCETTFGGMTLRDYFSGQALAGYLASWAGMDTNPTPEDASAYAYRYADAMLAARRPAAAAPSPLTRDRNNPADAVPASTDGSTVDLAEIEGT